MKIKTIQNQTIDDIFKEVEELEKNIEQELEKLEETIELADGEIVKVDKIELRELEKLPFGAIY